MYNMEQFNSGYASLSAGGLAAGTNAGTFKTVNTVTYLSDGLFKSKGATDNLAFSAGHTALGNNQRCVFAVWLDASGNVTTTQGPIVEAALSRAPMPAPNPGKTLVGLVKVSTGAAQTFTPGTSTLGSGNTAAYADAATLPGTAQ